MICRQYGQSSGNVFLGRLNSIPPTHPVHHWDGSRRVAFIFKCEHDTEARRNYGAQMQWSQIVNKIVKAHAGGQIKDNLTHKLKEILIFNEILKFTTSGLQSGWKIW